MGKLDFIYNRKSIRKFKDDKLPKEDIIEMIRAATYAPSPKNQQNWHFAIIDDKDKIMDMAVVVEDGHRDIANMFKCQKEKINYMKFMKYYTLFKNAPVVVVVYGKEYDMIEYKILKENGASEEILNEILSPRSDAQSIGAAVENFLLAATAMGYGACYMTGPTHSKKKLEDAIGFSKEGYDLMAMIAVGVPEGDIHPQPPRKPIEEVVTFLND